MPFPRTLAKLNRVGLNRVVRRLAPYVPGLGVLIHTGRTSGATYHTPLNVFRSGDGSYTFALTYGPRTDWLRNVQAAGGCELITWRGRVRLVAPRIVHDKTRAAASPFARPILRLIRVCDFVVMDEVPDERLAAAG